MKGGEAARADRLLQDVPEGALAVSCPAGAPAEAVRGPLRGETPGRGRVERYAVFPAVEAAYHVFRAPWAAFHHAALEHVLELFYCRSGRVGWNLRGGAALYLGAGDLAVQSAVCCADSTMRFPLGCCEGISLSVDLRRLETQCPEILREAGFAPEALRRTFCEGKPAAISAGAALEGLFAPLYDAPPALRLPYLKLKTQELLLYLSALRPEEREPPAYVARQTEQIRALHALLTEHLDRRYTIEERSRRFLINTSTLKEVFKAVYGLPIATYMKEYRVRRAMELLRETDGSIAAVAAAVGYETQSKFTKAFKDTVGVLPSVYRRTCRDRREP